MWRKWELHLLLALVAHHPLRSPSFGSGMFWCQEMRLNQWVMNTNCYCHKYHTTSPRCYRTMVQFFFPPSLFIFPWKNDILTISWNIFCGHPSIFVLCAIPVAGKAKEMRPSCSLFLSQQGPVSSSEPRRQCSSDLIAVTTPPPTPLNKNTHCLRSRQIA